MSFDRPLAETGSDTQVLNPAQPVNRKFCDIRGAVLQFADANNNRFGLSFNADANNNLIVGNSVGNTFTNRTVLADGSALNDYHAHQIVYDAASAKASYYFDGNLIFSGWTTSNAGASTAPGLLWGALSSAGEGSININLIDPSSAPFPFVSMRPTNFTNPRIAYRGVLESAGEFACPGNLDCGGHPLGHWNKYLCGSCWSATAIFPLSPSEIVAVPKPIRAPRDLFTMGRFI